MIFQIYAEKFPGFVSIAIVDTFTGRHERVLLEVQKTMNDQQNLFKVRVKDIVTDSENPSICWIDLEIYYNPPNTTKTFCIQRGSLCSNQIYRFQDERYIIGFDISPYVDEEGYLS